MILAIPQGKQTKYLADISIETRALIIEVDTFYIKNIRNHTKWHHWKPMLNIELNFWR
jgi:hypothetical protein